MSIACECEAVSSPDAAYCGACGRPRRSVIPDWLSRACPRCLRAFPESALFCDACGAPLIAVPLKSRILTLSDASGHRISVNGAAREFGRADFADWVSPEIANLISRAHFRISSEGSDFLLEHVSTANPTVHNGSAVARPCRLTRGDVIDLAGGALRLLVRIE